MSSYPHVLYYFLDFKSKNFPDFGIRIPLHGAKRLRFHNSDNVWTIISLLLTRPKFILTSLKKKTKVIESLLNFHINSRSVPFFIKNYVNINESELPISVYKYIFLYSVTNFPLGPGCPGFPVNPVSPFCQEKAYQKKGNIKLTFKATS